MIKYIKCFDEVFDKTKPYTIMDGGARVIQVKKIVGTVGKCGELDKNFRYIKRSDISERRRWYRLKEAAEKYHFFPSIEVYKYEGQYYVVDGNRRTAAAKALGMEFIDAHIKEYVHKSDKQRLKGALSRRRFESETGLRNLDLTHENGYGILLDEVISYPYGENMPEKVRKWYSERHLPACSKIEKSTLPARYSGHVTGDIYIMVTEFYRDFMGGVPNNTGFETLISGFKFVHKIPERRFFRLLPFRVFHFLFFRKCRKSEIFHRDIGNMTGRE